MSIVSQLDLFAPQVEAIVYGPFLSRQQALARGLRHYYSGRPCSRGHYAARFVKCCKCVDCGRVQSLENMTKWYHSNQEVARERKRIYYSENKDVILARAKVRGRTPKAREKDRIRSRRRRECLEVRILGALRNRLCDAIRGKSRSQTTQDLLGCTVEQLKTHLEGLFQSGMTWDNWTHSGWHIDHIIPCAAFDLSDHEQQKRCFHYTNLQPLWAADNIRKGAKLPDSLP